MDDLMVLVRNEGLGPLGTLTPRMNYTAHTSHGFFFFFKQKRYPHSLRESGTTEHYLS